MSRYVDIDDIVSKARDFHAQMQIDEGPGNKYVDGFGAAIDFISLLGLNSRTDVQEVKHGHWMPYNETEGWRCPECRHATNERLLKWYRDVDGNICYQSVAPFYCSRCGIKMDLEDI